MSALGDPPPPKRVKSGHLLSEKNTRKLRQMSFRDKTAYAWGHES